MWCWTAKRSCRIQGALPTITRCVANSRANACQLLKPQASLWALHTSGPFPSTSASLKPLRLPPVQDRFHNVGRQAGERQEPADVGVRDTLLLRKVGDRLRLTALDLAPPAVRTHERLDQRLVAARLRRRCRHALRRHDQLPAAPALQAHRDADGQSVDFKTHALGHYSAASSKGSEAARAAPPGPPAPRRGCKSRPHAA